VILRIVQGTGGLYQKGEKSGKRSKKIERKKKFDKLANKSTFQKKKSHEKGLKRGKPK